MEATWKRPAGAGSSSGSGAPRSPAQAPLRAGDELVGEVVRRGEHGDGEPHVAPAAGDRHLRHGQLAGREARPVRRGATLGGEREAAHRDQPGAGRPVRRVGLGGAGQPPPGAGELGEPARAGRAQAGDRADGGQRGSVAVGLLEAEPRLAGPARREGDGARVDVRGEPQADAGEHILPAPARAPHGPLAAGAERGAHVAGKCHARAARAEADGHGPSG